MPVPINETELPKRILIAGVTNPIYDKALQNAYQRVKNPRKKIQSLPRLAEKQRRAERSRSSNFTIDSSVKNLTCLNVESSTETANDTPLPCQMVSLNCDLPKTVHRIVTTSLRRVTNQTIDQDQKKIFKEHMSTLGLQISKINYKPPNQSVATAKRFTQHEPPSCTDVLRREITSSMGRIANSNHVDFINLSEGCSVLSVLQLGPSMQDSAVNITPYTERKYSVPGRPRILSGTAGKVSPKKNQIAFHAPVINVPGGDNLIYTNKFGQYRDMLFGLGYAHRKWVDTELLDREGGVLRKEAKYIAWVGFGNNGNLIRGLIKRRYWWHLTEQRSHDVNFLWTQLKCPEYFARERPVGRITFEDQQVPIQKSLTAGANRRIQKAHQAILDEFKDLGKILTTNDERTFLEAHIRQPKLRQNTYSQRAEVLGLVSNKKGGQDEVGEEKYKNEAPNTADTVTQTAQSAVRIHNHLIHSYFLGNKKALFYCLKQYYELTGGMLFQVIPLTFHIKTGMKDPNYKRFIAYYTKRAHHIKRLEKEALENGEQKGTKGKMRNIWIVKPGELTNRGNGITVIDQIYELNSIIKSQKCHENGSAKTFIVQLYIDRPLLYKGRKFDIRHYVLITHLHGVMRAYWHQEGYIRTSSFEFDIHDFDRTIHLTNDAVQKHTSSYGKYQAANKISYADLQRYLEASFPKRKPSFYQQILPRMKTIALDAVKASYLKISQPLQHNFQIFGLDFMIDSELQPWLIEINTNPCLEVPCPLLSRIIPQMVDQALRLSLDVVFPPPGHYPNTARHLVPDARLQSLRFQLIFDERFHGKQLVGLYGKRAQKDSLLKEIGDMSDGEEYADDGEKLQGNDNLQL